MADDGLLAAGAVFLVVGVLLMFVPYLCLVGLPMAIVGFIVLIVAAVREPPRPGMYGYPPPYAGYPPYPTVQPGQFPLGGSPTPHCPRCGQLLTYVPQYQRWYCSAENVYPWA